jgi:hypothetical protein
MNLDDHQSNFKYIIESLESYIKDNCQEEKLTYFANLSDSFDIGQILEGNEKTLINLIKLLLFLSSLSSIKEKHLDSINSLENEIQNEYFSSVELFLKLDNNNQDISLDLNNLDNLNLSESIMNELKELKNSNYNIENQKSEDKNKEPENNNNQKPDLTLGSSTFAINNKIDMEDNPFGNDYETESKAMILGKITDNINMGKEVKEEKFEKENDSEKKEIQTDLNNYSKEFLPSLTINKKHDKPEEKLVTLDQIINSDSTEPIREKTTIFVNTPKGDSEPGEVKDNSNLNNPFKEATKTEKVIVEEKTYCKLIKIGKDGKPIDSNIDVNMAATGNKNIGDVIKCILPTNEISFFLSGGDFLQRKIDYLDETIMKNSEMYNKVIEKYEKQIKNLKIQLKDELENMSKEKNNYMNEINNLSSMKNNTQGEIDNIKNELNDQKKKYEDLLNVKNRLEKEISDSKNSNDLKDKQKNSEISELKRKIDELNGKLNKSNIENEQMKKTIEDLRQQKETEILEQQKQIKDIKSLKDQEISMLNDKIRNIENNREDKNSSLEKQFEDYKNNSNNIQNKLLSENNDLKKQLYELPILKQDVEKYKKLFEDLDNKNAKLQNENMDLKDILERGGKLNKELKQKINNLENKFKSEPFYAKQIMSETLFNFAYKIMTENNNQK